MPELPEVETMCRGIAGVIGSRVADVQRPPCDRRPILFSPDVDVFAKRIVGRQIVRIGRRGKRVLIYVDDDQVIVIEPRMTGLVLVAQPPTDQHLRLRVVLDGGPHEELLFWDRRGLGTVRLLTKGEADDVLGLERIGADALEIECDELRKRLGASRRAIKVALLDQKSVAGIGNLYAAEILYVAGVDPRVSCDRLAGPQWQRIHRAISIVLDDAILHEGSTLSDGTYRNALNQDGGYQNMHRVYDRAGQPCVRCGDLIVRIVQAQRSTFFCPTCQRRRGLHASVSVA
jgi:formamidopyrimidine-DNA glycosylase